MKVPTKNSFPINDEVYKQVYDSIKSLTNKHRWLTRDTDI
jgi:hypothetical protein